MKREALFDIPETMPPIVKATPGRSSLLRAGQVAMPRARRFRQRRLLTAALIGFVVFDIAIVALRLLPADGPGRLFYLVHDRVWLVAYGTVWLQFFPYGLIWLVPLCIILGLVLLEFLGLAAPFRNGQIRLIEVGMDRLSPSRFIAIAKLTHARGQILAVLAERRSRAFRAALAHLEAGSSPDLTSLVRTEYLALRLARRIDLDEVLSALEVLALHAWADAPLPESLINTLDARDPAADTLRQVALTPVSPEASLRLAARLAAAKHPATAACAALTLAIALSARQDGRPEHLRWLDAWRQRQIGDAPPALAKAEGLIRFETWAALIEASVKRAPVPGLLGEVLGAKVFWPRPRGEVFARFGQEAASP